MTFGRNAGSVVACGEMATSVGRGVGDTLGLDDPPHPARSPTTATNAKTRADLKRNPVSFDRVFFGSIFYYSTGPPRHHCGTINITMKRKNFGFTIVEIIIVITIIGVLAAMAILGVQGAQIQARNTQTVTAVARYKSALEKYVRDNGDYPLNKAVCLGTGYPDVNADGVGDCWHLNTPVNEWSGFSDALKPYVDNDLPNPSQQVLHAPNFDQVGAEFVYRTDAKLDGVAHYWYIAYTMEGDHTKCPFGPVLSFVSWPSMSTTPPASGYSEAWGTAGTGCWIALPSPNKL